MQTDLQHRTEAEKIALGALFGCRPEELTDELMDERNREREAGRAALPRLHSEAMQAKRERFLSGDRRAA